MILASVLTLLIAPQLVGVGVVYAAGRSGRRELRALAPFATALTFGLVSLSLWSASMLTGRVSSGALGLVIGTSVLGVLMHWTVSSAALAGPAASRRRGQMQREGSDVA